MIFGFRIEWTRNDGSKAEDIVCLDCMAHPDSDIYRDDSREPISLDEPVTCSVCGEKS